MSPEDSAIKKPGSDRPSQVKWGAVVFLDRLGTKAVWTSNPPDEAIRRSEARLEKAKERFDNRSTAMSLYLADLSSATVSATIYASLSWDTSPGTKAPDQVWSVEVPVNFDLPENVIGFSDSLIVWREIPDKSAAVFDELCADLIQFFNDTLNDGDFYRGVVSLGEFVTPRNAVLGPAVNEAGAWYEVPDWMGISLTPSAEWFVRQEDDFANPSTPYFEWRIPRHHKEQSQGIPPRGVALAWPRRWAGGKGSLLQAFGEQLVVPDIEAKYRNTLDFFESVLPAKNDTAPR